MIFSKSLSFKVLSDDWIVTLIAIDFWFSGILSPSYTSKTLTDNDLEKINNLIIETVENKTGAKIRS